MDQRVPAADTVEAIEALLPWNVRDVLRAARRAASRGSLRHPGTFPANLRPPLCANVTWNTCLLEFTVRGSITHGSSTGIFDEPRSVDFEPGHPVRSP